MCDFKLPVFIYLILKYLYFVYFFTVYGRFLLPANTLSKIHQGGGGGGLIFTSGLHFGKKKDSSVEAQISSYFLTNICSFNALKLASHF